MKKLYYYQVLLLLGSLLAGPLHAANNNNNQDNQKYQQGDQKYQKEEPQASSKSFYQHGDFTFINREKDKVDQEELKQGLIDLSYRIKAKDGRKVYFFIGGTRAGKSMSILALQGNKIEKIEEDYSDESDSALFDSDASDPENLLPKEEFEIKYALPKEACPKVEHSSAGKKASTLIYYPDPKNQKYEGIAFADTEGFFGLRKANSAEKCLSAVSLSYALQVNKIGGLVLVISAPDLEEKRGKGLRDIAYVLEKYFAKAVSNQRMSTSILVMITKVHSNKAMQQALYRFKQLIQIFYQMCYTDRHGLNLEKVQKVDKGAILNQPAMQEGVQKELSEKEKIKIEEEIKKIEATAGLKRFFQMLLEQDVPKDEINDIKNFQLDQRKFCFMFPWLDMCVQRILDKKLASLQPISSDDLCNFDNPVSQYMETSIRGFSSQLNEVIQPLLALRHEIDIMEKQLQGRNDKKIIDQAIQQWVDHTVYWKNRLNILKQHHTVPQCIVMEGLIKDAKKKLRHSAIRHYVPMTKCGITMII